MVYLISKMKSILKVFDSRCDRYSKNSLFDDSECICILNVYLYFFLEGFDF